jgi:hypothetical protein
LIYSFFNQSPFSIAGNTLPLLNAEVCPHFVPRASDLEHCFAKRSSASAGSVNAADGKYEIAGTGHRLGAGESPPLLDHGQWCELERHHAF